MHRIDAIRRLAALAMICAGQPAAAQDSIVRLQEADTGQPLISVLGTGLGLSFATLALELGCPTPQSWTMAVTGVQAQPGTQVSLGFGDPMGGYTEVRAWPVDYREDRLRLRVDRNAFRAALAQARTDYPEPAGTDIRVVVGGMVGVSVQRDTLVRALTAFAQDCEAARPPPRPAARLNARGPGR
ncbi:hypothetical protein AAFN86_18525 [Roseomonas sp. CAU 1739]|uniref:hypothetical protein n=1 Tax=Roseomonas sp. CAU 1739 TaxID=3140364 RepID=UPI00325B705A